MSGSGNQGMTRSVLHFENAGERRQHRWLAEARALGHGVVDQLAVEEHPDGGSRVRVHDLDRKARSVSGRAQGRENKEHTDRPSWLSTVRDHQARDALRRRDAHNSIGPAVMNTSHCDGSGTALMFGFTSLAMHPSTTHKP